MFDFLAFTYLFYSQTVTVLSFFSVPDIVMRRRSICRRRTKSIVVFVFIDIFSAVLYLGRKIYSGCTTQVNKLVWQRTIVTSGSMPHIFFARYRVDRPAK